jgi:hypothetical protein
VIRVDPALWTGIPKVLFCTGTSGAAERGGRIERTPPVCRSALCSRFSRLSVSRVSQFSTLHRCAPPPHRSLPAVFPHKPLQMGIDPTGVSRTNRPGRGSGCRRQCCRKRSHVKLGLFAYPSRKYISDFEFAIHSEIRTPLLKSRGFLRCAPSKSELNTGFWTDYELTEYSLLSFWVVLATETWTVLYRGICKNPHRENTGHMSANR